MVRLEEENKSLRQRLAEMERQKNEMERQRDEALEALRADDPAAHVPFVADDNDPLADDDAEAEVSPEEESEEESEEQSESESEEESEGDAHVPFVADDDNALADDDADAEVSPEEESEEESEEQSEGESEEESEGDAEARAEAFVNAEVAPLAAEEARALKNEKACPKCTHAAKTTHPFNYRSINRCLIPQSLTNITISPGSTARFGAI